MFSTRKPIRVGVCTSCGWRIVILLIIRWNFPSCYDSLMRDLVVLFIHLIASLARLLGPGGARSLVAESLLLKHQLLNPESLPPTSAESVRVGPDPCRLAGALAASPSPAPLCHCAQAFDPDRPSPSHVQAKVPHAVLT